MNALPAAAPPETIAELPQQRRSAGGGTGWQQQLKLAQATGWFHHPVPMSQQGEDAAGTAEAAARGARTSAGAPHTSFRMTRGAEHSATATGLPTPGRGGDAKTPRTTSESSLQIQGATETQPNSESDAAAGASAGARQSRSPTAAAARAGNPLPARPHEPAPSRRIHVEAGPQGLQVWVGIDGDAAQVAARAASIVAELRRAPGFAGQRLGLVVCNGVTVYAAAPVPVKPNPKEP